MNPPNLWAFIIGESTSDKNGMIALSEGENPLKIKEELKKKHKGLNVYLLPYIPLSAAIPTLKKYAYKPANNYSTIL